MPKALIFDVFGTVVDWRRGVAREAEAFFSTRGVTLDAEAFADAWRAKYQPAMERIRDGSRGYIALDVLHRENLDQTLDEFALGGGLATTTACETSPPDALEIDNPREQDGQVIAESVLITLDDLATLGPGEVLTLDLGLDVIYEITPEVWVTEGDRVVLSGPEAESTLDQWRLESAALGLEFSPERSFGVVGDPSLFGLTDDEVSTLQADRVIPRRRSWRYWCAIFAYGCDRTED